MTQGKQHGPVIELNRMQMKRSRGRGRLAGPDGLNSVFGQMCSKWSILGQEDLLLPHRVWKVRSEGRGEGGGSRGEAGREGGNGVGVRLEGRGEGGGRGRNRVGVR